MATEWLSPSRGRDGKRYFHGSVEDGLSLLRIQLAYVWTVLQWLLDATDQRNLWLQHRLVSICAFLTDLPDTWPRAPLHVIFA